MKNENRTDRNQKGGDASHHAAAWSDRTIVQRVVAQIPWRQNITLLERLDDSATRLWYAEQASRLGWSQPILSLQIEGHAHERQGKALTNFPATLPSADSDMAAQVFKDPYPFDFLGTADPRREREVEQALVDHIQLWQKPSAKLALEQKSQTPSGELPSALIGQTPSGSEVSHNNLINLGFCCER